MHCAFFKPEAKYCLTLRYGLQERNESIMTKYKIY